MTRYYSKFYASAEFISLLNHNTNVLLQKVVLGIELFRTRWQLAIPIFYLESGVACDYKAIDLYVPAFYAEAGVILNLSKPFDG